MVKTTEQRSNDWLSSAHTNLLAWWLPKGAIIAALFVAVPLRVAVWTVALLWIGTTCILNAKRCGRIHCRYTGPYYLAMILPVLILALDLISASIYAWLALALLIVCGGWVIWWATEQLWGRYSNA
jgi:ABC-type molybdate transport system permease subunit